MYIYIIINIILQHYYIIMFAVKALYTITVTATISKSCQYRNFKDLSRLPQFFSKNINGQQLLQLQL